MLTKGWLQFTSGFFAFIAAHLIEAARWRDWFQGQFGPWFLNSGRAILFTSALLFVVGAIASLRSDRPVVRGLYVAAGATTAMAVVLFAGDPGTIFPIVLAMGGAAVVASTVAGALAGAALRPR